MGALSLGVCVCVSVCVCRGGGGGGGGLLRITNSHDFRLKAINTN